MKAYKGFNEDLTCRGFQYEEGKSYHDDEAEMCESGFHACLDPIYCLDFYLPNRAVYHEVELGGVTDGSPDSTKVCGTDITIGKRLSVKEMCEAHFEYVKDCEDPFIFVQGIATTVGSNHTVAIDDLPCVVGGYNHNAFEISGHSVASGRSHNSFQGKDYDIIAGGGSCLISANKFNVVACADENMISVGDRNVIASNDRCYIEAGDYNKIITHWGSHVKAGDSNTIVGGCFNTLEAGRDSTIVGRGRCSGGPNSVVVARGCGVRVKGGLGSILVIAEESPSWSSTEIVDYGAAVVDGEKIKPDIWYKLHKGEFVEVVERKTEVTDNEGEDDK